MDDYACMGMQQYQIKLDIATSYYHIQWVITMQQYQIKLNIATSYYHIQWVISISSWSTLFNKHDNNKACKDITVLA